jgi:hypothetical protein
MTTKTKGCAGGYYQATPNTSDSQEFTQKPNIDLLSWAALGANVKPSRTDRKQKRAWKRRVA